MKYLFSIIAFMVCVCVKAQYNDMYDYDHPVTHTAKVRNETDKHPLLKWDKSLGVSVGYDRVFKAFDGFESMPQNIFEVDCNCYGIMFGMGCIRHRTGYKVYDFDERLSTYVYKLGFTLDLFDKKDGYWRFTPYGGMVTADVDDESGNDIGARQKYGIREKKFMGGLKVAYVNKDGFEIGANISNLECGVSLGYQFNFSKF